MEKKMETIISSLGIRMKKKMETRVWGFGIRVQGEVLRLRFWKEIGEVHPNNGPYRLQPVYQHIEHLSAACASCISGDLL